MKAKEKIPHEPIAPEGLARQVADQLEAYCEFHGDGLGRRLWNDRLRDFSLMAAELIRADIAVWLAEENKPSVNYPNVKYLEPVFNGPRAESLVGKHKQPLTKGIVSMVYATEQSYSEANVSRSGQIDKTVDRLLGIDTRAMAVCPLHFGASLRGVVSAVRFVDNIEHDPGDPEPFSEAEVLRFERMVGSLGRLFDEELFSTAFDFR